MVTNLFELNYVRMLKNFVVLDFPYDIFRILEKEKYVDRDITTEANNSKIHI